MTKEEQLHLLDVFHEKAKEIITSKGDDYALQVDRLSNFKLAGSICNLSPAHQCLSLIATKVARLGNLISVKNATPNNESIEDSVKDLTIYSFLLQCILHEETLQLAF